MKFKSEIVTQASGSIGGTTYSHNRGGMYRRARSVPTNPNTTKQQAVRSIFSGLVSAWLNTLTQANRDTWKTYADNTPRMDSLGNELILTGQQMYVGANTGRQQVGLSSVANGPTTYNRGEAIVSLEDSTNAIPNELDIQGDALGLAFVFSSATSDDGDCAIWIGPPINASTNFWKGPYQFAATEAVAASQNSSAFTATASTLPITTPLAVGQRRPVKLVQFYDDGRYTSPFNGIVTVVDNTP